MKLFIMQFLQSPVFSTLFCPTAPCSWKPSAYVPSSVWETKFHTHIK